MKNKKVAQVGEQCVACGTCIRVCPVGAITITDGIKAQVNKEQCIGCGRCLFACPASVIKKVDWEGKDEK